MKTFRFNTKINDLAYDQLKFLVANSIIKIFLKYFLNFFPDSSDFGLPPTLLDNQRVRSGVRLIKLFFFVTYGDE
jgi:hypothetical protein